MARRTPIDPETARPVIGRVRVTDVRRLLVAVMTFARTVLEVWRRRQRGDRLLEATIDEVRRDFEALGPTYVKLGQMIASTPGLFPPVLARGFEGCLDEVSPLPWAEIRRVVRRELGDDPARLFTSFSPSPLASASIGQVHRAVLLDGTEVVVKVQRPGIRERIETDLRILHLLARVAERVSRQARLTQPVAIVEDFAVTLRHELSFMVESRAMEEVVESLQDFPDATRVHIPTVDWRHTTPRVLTMEYVHGHRLDDVDALRAAGVDPASLLKVAVRSWLHGTLVHGVFHGDLHAGNLLVDGAGRITFLDFGICGHLPQASRDALLAALPALMSRDMHALAETIFSAVESEGPVDLEAIGTDMAATILPIFDRPLAEVSYALAFIEVVRIGIRHGVLLPPDLILVFKQFFYVERFTRLLAPEWAPLTDADLLADVLAARARRDDAA